MRRTACRIRLTVAIAVLGIPGEAQAAVAATACQTSNRRIAITVDDLPFANQRLPLAEQQTRTTELLRTLKNYRTPAIGFVNEDKLLVNGEIGARVRLLREWLDAGTTLGNHGFGHLSLQKTPLPEAEAAVL